MHIKFRRGKDKGKLILDLSHLCWQIDCLHGTSSKSSLIKFLCTTKIACVFAKTLFCYCNISTTVLLNFPQFSASMFQFHYIKLNTSLMYRSWTTSRTVHFISNNEAQVIVSFLTTFTISMNVGEIWPYSTPKIFKRYGCHLVRAPQREMKRIIFILESLLKLIKYQVIKKLAQSSWMKKSNFSCDESNLGSYMKISGFSCKFMKSSTSGSVN